MTEIERLNGVIAELELQRAWAMTRAAQMAGELAAVRAALKGAKPEDQQIADGAQ